MGQAKQNSTDVILTLKEKIEFAVGDMGFNLMFYWVTSFLMIFCTDVFGISASVVATLLLVVRLFDAVNDPLLGSFADKTKRKTGRYEPWLKWGGVGLSVSGVFLFWAHPQWPYTLKVLYLIVTYMSFTVFGTAQAMAYGALSGTMTTNIHERTKMSTMRFTLVTVANMCVTALAVPLMNLLGDQGRDNVQGYFLTLVIFAAVSIPMFWLNAVKCKEVVMIPEKQKKVSVKIRMKSMFGCRPMLTMIIGMLFFSVVYYGRAAVYPYYFKYYCGDYGLLTVFAVLVGIGGVAGSLAASPLHKLFKHKGRTMVANLLLYAVAAAAMFWLPPSRNMIAFSIISLINGFCGGVHMCLQYATLPDAIDYSRYKTGAQLNAFLYASASFSFKVGNAVGSAGVAAILGVLGYVANKSQSASVMNGINIMMTVGTSVFCLLAIVGFAFYNLSDEKYNLIKKEICYEDSAVVNNEETDMPELVPDGVETI